MFPSIGHNLWLSRCDHHTIYIKLDVVPKFIKSMSHSVQLTDNVAEIPQSTGASSLTRVKFKFIESKIKIVFQNLNNEILKFF